MQDQDLNVTLIQTRLHWQNIGANLAMLEEKIWQIEGGTDLIVLPEMFNTGFSMEVEQLSEPMNLTTFKWMKQMAAQTKAVVTGSFIVRDKDQYYNRLIWMQPDGEFQVYDKRHLFRMAKEDEQFNSGQQRVVCEWKGWKVCPLICYDLRFPVWSRNFSSDAANPLEYDVLIYVANWPAARVNAWDTLLKARALENLCFTVGVNRVGEDGNNIAYNGYSQVVDPKGNDLCNFQEVEVVHTVSLSKNYLTRFREKFPTYLDADKFKIMP
ncbi:amidohydrolase [Fulvivirga sp. M361]|uniref:amidohydrolase n=1 Tax=Fulvivirga sp. M361 TaxID=2594266 RepID=UPI00117AC16A|nr:amidohydrolase [Fulvivirga sp. M361]TRX51625.1 amidohydrolase [Fulvivirga sp. M361]